jgi:hypothetical protein
MGKKKLGVAMTSLNTSNKRGKADKYPQRTFCALNNTKYQLLQFPSYRERYQLMSLR